MQPTYNVLPDIPHAAVIKVAGLCHKCL